MRADVYISADVETDGPIPGPYSMLSFGLVVAGRYDGRSFDTADLDRPETFYRELRPISDEFLPEALAVSGLDREQLRETGSDPRHAMDDAAQWVATMAAGDRPVLVAYPASFDWTWLYWYFVRFAEHGSPFGFSGCLDVKTMIATRLRVPLAQANKASLPPALLPDRPHTHHALDDALEQAELFVRLHSWPGGDPP